MNIEVDYYLLNMRKINFKHGCTNVFLMILFCVFIIGLTLILIEVMSVPAKLVFNEAIEYKFGASKICKTQKNVVYIKMIKCGSETISNIFRRYAYMNNLSVVLPPLNKIYL